MDLWENMKKCESHLTPKEMEVYKLVLEQPYVFVSSTAMNLASRFGIAQSAISRFCQKLGFNGFSDFRISLGLAMATADFREEQQEETETRDLAYYMSDLIYETRKALPAMQLKVLAERTMEAADIFLSGHGNSYHPAHFLSIRLMLVRKPAIMIQPGLEIETIHIMKNTDIVFLFSAQNPTHRDFVSFVADLPADARPYLVLITNTNQHPLRRMVDEIICLPSWTSLHYPIMVDSSMAPYAFCSFFSEELDHLIKDGSVH